MLQIVVDILWFQEHSHIWLERKCWLKDIFPEMKICVICSASFEYLEITWLATHVITSSRRGFQIFECHQNLTVGNANECKYNLIVYACGRLRLRKFEPVGIFFLELLHHVNCSSLQEDPSIKNNKNIICANLVTQQYSAWLVIHFHHLAAPPNLRV